MFHLKQYSRLFLKVAFKNNFMTMKKLFLKKKNILLNKSDKATEESGFEQSALKEYISEETPVISISAKYGDGIDNFIMELKNMMEYGHDRHATNG